MPILDLVTREVVSVERGATLQFAAHLMKKYHVGSLVVVEANGSKQPIGVITDRDMVVEVVAENRPITCRVDEVMSRNPIVVFKDDGIADVIEKMENNGIGRVIVVNEAGHAIGLVSNHDILNLLAKEMNGMSHLSERQIENERNRNEEKGLYLF